MDRESCVALSGEKMSLEESRKLSRQLAFHRMHEALAYHEGAWVMMREHAAYRVGIIEALDILFGGDVATCLSEQAWAMYEEES